MKYLLVALFFLCAPMVQAYNPISIELDRPFDQIAIPMDTTAQQQSYLGSLETYPHLYEFQLTEAATLEVTVRQRATNDAEPINLILLSVHPDTERISEVIRLRTPLEERTKDYVGSLGISVYESEQLALDLEPGTYRLEVSSPLNDTAYELDFGSDSISNGYIGTFGTIWQVQQHFGYSFIQYLFSTFILYQLGILVLVGGIVYTWRKRKDISHAA